MIATIIKNFSKSLPHFPDGRIDYSNSDTTPVLTCLIKFQDQILLLKRSDQVRTYQGMWNTVAGYLDELKPVEEKVRVYLEKHKGTLPKIAVRETERKLLTGKK